MSQYYYYPMQPSVPMHPGPVQSPDAQQHELSMLMDAAKTGAIIGATGAAAMQLHRHHQEGISLREGVQGTVKGALHVGLAATAATAVGQLFRNSSALSLAATLATGTAVMYVLNKPDEAKADE